MLACHVKHSNFFWLQKHCTIRQSDAAPRSYHKKFIHDINIPLSGTRLLQSFVSSLDLSLFLVGEGSGSRGSDNKDDFVLGCWAV